jgi:hypothetical protein
MLTCTLEIILMSTCTFSATHLFIGGDCLECHAADKSGQLVALLFEATPKSTPPSRISLYLSSGNDA